jgi:hypothetical protein
MVYSSAGLYAGGHSLTRGLTVPIPDVEPETPAAPLSLPRIDWAPITVGAVALLAVAGGAAAIGTDVADVATPQASHLSVVLTVAASCFALMAVQLGTSYTRRRRDMARDRVLHQLASDCHAETVEHLATVARAMEQISAKLAAGGQPGAEAGRGAPGDPSTRGWATQLLVEQLVAARQAAGGADRADYWQVYRDVMADLGTIHSGDADED